MPRIPPLGGEVTWPSDEGVLGVVGVAPWATLDFCRALYGEVQALKDWHYPRVLLDINTKIPSRGRHFELGEADPSPVIAETIRELHVAGATVVVVPCNTAHILYDRWASDAQVPVPNIIEETLKSAAIGGAHRVSALVSSSLFSFDLYGKAAVRYGLQNCLIDEAGRETVAAVIGSVKTTGGLSPEVPARLETLAAYLKSQGVDTVLLGCTELGVLKSEFTARGFTTVDSNLSLARAALKLLNIQVS